MESQLQSSSTLSHGARDGGNNEDRTARVVQVAQPRNSSPAPLETPSGDWYQPLGRDEAYTCCFLWRPEWAQQLLCPLFFLICVCLVVLGDAVALGAFTGIATTLETRYRLSASHLGVLVTVYSAGTMAALPLVSYLGGRRGTNRPRWIAWGTVLVAAGTFLSALPQFVFGKYDAVPGSSDQVDALVCTADDNSTDRCSSYHAVGAESSAAFWILSGGSLISGAGYAAIPTLALSYIDDNCITETTALYAGIIESMYGVGSMFGFFLSAFFLTLWVDFYRLEPGAGPGTGDPAVPSPDHPGWVGAWWLGLLLCGGFFLLSCLPLFGFPRWLPERFRQGSVPTASRDGGRDGSTDGSHCEDVDSEADQKAQELHDKYSTYHTLEGGANEGAVKGLLKTYLRLMRNPVLVFITLGMACQAAVVYGVSTFFAKYLESQFEVTATFADLLTGVVLIPPYGVGWILGGYIVRKTRMGYPKMFLFAMAAVVVGVACFVPQFFLGCNNPQIAGVTVGYEDQSVISLVADCNANCGCTVATYQPVCDAAGDVIYFSPCFAGCNSTSYNFSYNCSCLSGPSDTAQAGLCEFHCRTLVPFLAVQVLQTMAITLAGAPQLILVLKSVDPADKTAALGFNGLFRGLGALVGPMMYAAFVDQSCLVWQSECGQYGSCQIYDVDTYRKLFVGVSLIVSVVGAAGACPAYYFIRRTFCERAVVGVHHIALTDVKKVDSSED